MEKMAWTRSFMFQTYHGIGDMTTLQTLSGSVYSFVEQSACRSERFHVSITLLTGFNPQPVFGSLVKFCMLVFFVTVIVSL